ncbi:MAG: hypothetical protein ACTHN5_16410 [Phycisphaerae bacterium]
MTRNSLNQQLIDAAASEALGANTPAESAAYQQEVAAAGDDARRLDRQLRETVARLASASPYMAPPADLRGRLLQATAPTTFRMEDYRKVTRDTGRFYRWGFYAALAFLAAGAWFNLSTQTQLQNTQGQVAAMQQQAKERNVALAAFLNPNANQITFKDKDSGKTVGKAIVDDKTRTAVVILANGAVPPGKSPQLSVPGKDGKEIAYNTVLITAPADVIQAPKGTDAVAMLKIKTNNIAPDPVQPKIARVGQ